MGARPRARLASTHTYRTLGCSALAVPLMKELNRQNLRVCVCVRERGGGAPTGSKDNEKETSAAAAEGEGEGEGEGGGLLR